MWTGTRTVATAVEQRSRAAAVLCAPKVVDPARTAPSSNGTATG